MSLSKVRLANLRNPKVLLSLLLQLTIVLLSVATPLLYPQQAHATVTEGFVRFDRLATAQAVTGTACLKSTLITQTGVIITFPIGWTISSTIGNWTANTTNIVSTMKDPIGGGAAEAWPGINNATAVNGLSVTFPTTAFTAGHFYCFNFAGASSTVGTAGNDQTGQLKTTGGSPFTDSMDYATSVVAAAGEQIVVSASVSATMTFALTGNAIALGTLNSTSAVSGAVTEQVSTNARNGWTSWIKGTNGSATTGALHSALAPTSDIIVPAGAYPTVYDLTSTTGYVIDADAGSGTPTIATAYDGNTVNKGGIPTTLFQQMATKTTPGATDTVVINARAKIVSTQTAANDYTDTLTVVAAGSF
jgi:hypothetical protein